MGIQARNANDRLRTVWTPEMDRFFIGLMLDQVKEGNRYDDQFGKLAWKHMSTVFNEKFKFQYEKDILKNRHKTLRNLYRAVKNLLNQRGFSWDPKRKMVRADNRVWEEYLKVHKDARSFRVKTIPYYNDLCAIFGHGTTEQEGGDNVDLDKRTLQSGENKTSALTQTANTSQEAAETVPGTTVEEDGNISTLNEIVNDTLQEMPSETESTIPFRTRTSWQPSMDRYFINLLLEQVRKGSKIDGVFRREAWMEMIASFNAKFGFNYDMDILKNRYKTLRRQYNAVNNLLELDGFAWDDTRQMVTADDSLWQDCIKKHADARQFMTRPVPYYKDLRVICRDGNADDSDCFSPQCLEPQNEVQGEKSHGSGKRSQSPAESVSSEDQVGNTLEPGHRLSKTAGSNMKGKRQSGIQSSSPHPKKSRSEDDSMASAIRKMATVVSSLTEKKKDEETSNTVSIENVIAAVQELPDMDEDLILDACDFLEDEMKAKTFMALDPKLRKKWLLRKLRPDL
ncbi:hypothetical protein SLA2020_292840 [Shorea laevis]